MTDSAMDASALWEDFCDNLKAAGEYLIADGVPCDPVTQAEGLRYLSRMARASLEWYVEFNDPAFPVLYRPAHETIKLGADNPDNIYQKAVVDGRFDYVIQGSRGSIDYLSFATSKGSYAANFKQIETGFLDAGTLAVDSEGRFEIAVSARPKPGNWLPMEETSEALLVRQTFKDRTRETPADLVITRADTGAAPDPLTPARLQANLERAKAFYRNTLALFARWSREIRANPNTLPLWDQDFCQSVGGDPNIAYYHGHFALQPDEALLISLERIPQCQTWNIQVDNYWMESLDYRYHRISLNAHTAATNADGSVTLVLSHTNPGTDNWLSTAGHSEGTLCFRWVGAREWVNPTTTLVKLDSL